MPVIVIICLVSIYYLWIIHFSRRGRTGEEQLSRIPQLDSWQPSAGRRTCDLWLSGHMSPQTESPLDQGMSLSGHGQVYMMPYFIFSYFSNTVRLTFKVGIKTRFVPEFLIYIYLSFSMITFFSLCGTLTVLMIFNLLLGWEAITRQPKMEVYWRGWQLHAPDLWSPARGCRTICLCSHQRCGQGNLYRQAGCTV